jgi:hypothetical protein
MCKRDRGGKGGTRGGGAGSTRGGGDRRGETVQFEKAEALILKSLCLVSLLSV